MANWTGCEASRENARWGTSDGQITAATWLISRERQIRCTLGGLPACLEVTSTQRWQTSHKESGRSGLNDSHGALPQTRRSPAAIFDWVHPCLVRKFGSSISLYSSQADKRKGTQDTFLRVSVNGNKTGNCNRAKRLHAFHHGPLSGIHRTWRGPKASPVWMPDGGTTVPSSAVEQQNRPEERRSHAVGSIRAGLDVLRAPTIGVAPAARTAVGRRPAADVR